MNKGQERIYPLVPAIYRQRDVALGRPLHALCKVLDIELSHLREDIAGLYEQWFIETCAQWVVPYIGELAGVTGIETAVSNVATQRARVANTLGYRSRRGIASILANACADASGWPALPVEYFQRVITSANVGAVDLLASWTGALATATCDVSDVAATAYLDGPFSTVRRTVSVAAIDRPRAHVSGSTPECFNLPNLGIFLWRTPALPIEGTTPVAKRGGRFFTFHPLGIDAPLLRPPADRRSPWHAPTADNMPLWITRLLLEAWTDAWRTWTRLHPDSDPSESAAGLPSLGFTITVDGKPIPPQAIYAPARGLAGDDLLAQLDRPPSDPVFAVVDPERGRFAVSRRGIEEAPTAGSISVDWAWGQPGWIGGGPYDRQSTMVGPGESTFVILISKEFVSDRTQRVRFGDLEHAWTEVMHLATELGYCKDSPDPTLDPLDVLIRILDSATYDATSLDLPQQMRLTIQAVDGQRPTLRAGDDRASLTLRSKGRARVVLSGLLLGGRLDVSGELDLTLQDTTVRPLGDPGGAAVRWYPVDQKDTLGEPLLHLVRCITGPLHLQDAVTTSIRESIVDGHGGPAVSGTDGQLGPALQLVAVTVLGDVRAKAIEVAQDALVVGVVTTRSIGLEVLETSLFAVELQAPAGASRAPVVCSRPSRIPAAPFTSTRYGDPGYGQLRLDAGDQLLRGGTEGTEMGAYRSLASGQRLANLSPVRADYTPFGLDVGMFIMGQTTMSFSTDRGAPVTRAHEHPNKEACK